VRVKGDSPLHGIRYAMPVASAQVKSAVLIAGLYADGETTVAEPAVTRDHTERMLQSFGCDVSARGGVATVRPPRQLQATSIHVPGDISSAAFFVVAACIGAKEPFTIRGVGINPTRTGILEMLALMGADLRLINHRTCGAEPVADVEVRPSTLKGVRVPERLVPLAIDEFPAFFGGRLRRARRRPVPRNFGKRRLDRAMARGLRARLCNEVRRTACASRAADRRRHHRQSGRHRVAVIRRGEPPGPKSDRDPRRERRHVIPRLRRARELGRARHRERA
jgi:hypothetical protein